MHVSKHAALAHLTQDERASLFALASSVGLATDRLVHAALQRGTKVLPHAVRVAVAKIPQGVIEKLEHFPRDCTCCARVLPHDGVVECIFCHDAFECGVCTTSEGCSACQREREAHTTSLRVAFAAAALPEREVFAKAERKVPS